VIQAPPMGCWAGEIYGVSFCMTRYVVEDDTPPTHSLDLDVPVRFNQSLFRRNTTGHVEILSPRHGAVYRHDPANDVWVVREEQLREGFDFPMPTMVAYDKYHLPRDVVVSVTWESASVCTLCLLLDDDSTTQIQVEVAGSKQVTLPMNFMSGTEAVDVSALLLDQHGTVIDKNTVVVFPWI